MFEGNSDNGATGSDWDDTFTTTSVDMSSSDPQVPIGFRLVLVGKTGVGKSKVGNTLLDRPNYFIYGCDQESVTRECKYGSRENYGTKLQIVDTPGVFDTRKENAETQKEIQRCIGMTTPGPHAILLCVKMQRFDTTDCQTLDHFLKYFGKELLKFVIVVFTHLDQWEADQEEKQVPQSKEEYLKNVKPELAEFLKDCKYRHVFFNGRLKRCDNKNQVMAILNTVKEVVRENPGYCYTNEMYEEVNKILKKEMEENPGKTEDEIRQSKSFLSKVFDYLAKFFHGLV